MAPAAKLTAICPVTPGAPVPQDAVLEDFYRELYRELPGTDELFASTRISERHMAWDPRVAFADGFPAMGARMRAWEEHTLAMGRASLESVLAGVEREQIGSFVMASCTGYAGPTPEMLLAKEFGLRRTLRRTFIGHMGCFAAFNALKVALDALSARPDELVLLTCSEVCSVHVRPESTKEQALVHALFGDAAVTLLLSADERAPGPVVLCTHTETHAETSEAMTWRIQDDAFRMTLSPFVPVYIARAIQPFVQRLLEPAGLGVDDVEHWCVHPGGPKIIELVGDRLGLEQRQLAPSLGVLADYGNCSSTTVLLILDRILSHERPAPGEHAVLMAFGPGLTIEGALLRF